MGEWKKYKLGEILNFRRGHDLPHSKMNKGDIPVAGSNGIIGYHNEATPISPCITIGRSGNVGTPHIYERCWAHNTVLYINDFKNNNPLYLYYLLKTLPLSSFGGGSAVPTLNRNHIHPLLVKHTSDLNTQQKIASILKSLDDKIEVNRKINENLEQQAQALFKSWFVDFEPFKNGEFVESELGMIPKGWKISKIDDLSLYISDYVANGSFASLKENVTLYDEENYAYFVRNTDLKEKRFRVYVDRNSYDFLAKSVLYGGEIIISNVGDVGSVYLCPVLDRPMTLGNNIIMIKSDDKALQNYLYILFKYSYGKGLIRGITGGSAQPKFNKTDFKSLKIIIPPEDILNQSERVFSQYLQTMQSKDAENSRLAALRDTLLPKLMSGELKVNEL